MTVQGADRSIPNGPGSGESTDPSEPPIYGVPEPTARASDADQLAYLADLTGELADIAERLLCPTLAGLLVLAQTEANLQMRRR